MVPRETCDPCPSNSSPWWLPSPLYLPPDDLHPLFLIHIRAKVRGRVSGLDEEAAAKESKSGQDLRLRSELEIFTSKNKHDAVFVYF